MAAPITVNQSTTLVQIDTSVFANAPYVVLLSNLNSPGSLITIRDTFGAASSSNSILVSTTTGVRFLDGGGALSNLYTINQPYGFLTVTPKTSNIWGVTNTFAFPDSSQVANLNAIHVSSIMISSIGYIQNAIISTASISTICTNNLFINANMSVGQSTIAHAGFFVCSIRTLDDFIASSNIYAGSTISSLFGNITSTLTARYISTTDVWINGGLQTASSISTAGPMFVGSSISTTGNLAVGASTFIQGQLTVLQAAFFGSSISTTGALNVGYEAILNSSLQVSHNAFIGGNVSTLSNVTVGASLSVMSSLYTQWNMVTNSSILASGSFSTLEDVNIRRNLSTLGKAFIGQELYTTSSILTTGSFSTLQDVNVARNVSVLGNLYVKGTIQFDQTEVDLQDIMASSIVSQYNISTMSSFIAWGGLNVRQSTFLGGTVSSMSNFNIAGLLSTASTVVVGDSLIVAKTGFFGSNISTTSSIGLGGNLNVGGGAVLQSTLSTFGQAAFFSSVQIQGSLSVMSSIAAACNVFVGNTLSTSNLILYGSTSISTLAVTNTVGFGMNVSSSTLHFGLFSTSGAMNIGGRISTTNALIVGSTIDTQYLNVQAGMSVFSNAAFAQDVFARSSLLVGMSTVLNGGFYTQSPAYMADVQFTSNVVIGNPGGLQTNYGNLSNYGVTYLKGNLTVGTGITTLSNLLQIDNGFGFVAKNTISNDTWMSSLTTSSLVVSYYQSTIGNSAFFSSVQIQGGVSVFSTLAVEWNATFTRNLAASTICTNQLTISTLNVIGPSNTTLFVSSSTLHYGLFSSFGQIFTGKEISTMSSLSAGGNLNILSNATIGRNFSTLGSAGFGTTVNILGTTTGQGTGFFNTNLVTPLINNSSLQTSSILTSTLTAVNTSASNAFAISSLIQSNLYVPFLYNSSLQTSSIFTSSLTASNIFASNIAISSMMASTINVSTLSTVNLNASSIVAPMGAFSTMSVFSQAVISNVFARAIGVNCNSPQFAVDVAGIVNASYIYQNGSQYVPLISNLAFSSISTNFALIKNVNVPSYYVAVSLSVATNNGGIYSGATPATLAAVTPSPALAGAPTSFTALYYTGSVWYMAASNATNSLLYTTSSVTAWTASTPFTRITPVTGTLPSRWINCIAFNGEYYLLAGSDASGNIVRTTDFKAFTASAIPTTRTVKTLVWNNSIWVAGGKDSSGNVGFISYSTNGVSWTTATTTFLDVFSIVWNGYVFVALGNDVVDTVTNIKYSYDAITWTNANTIAPAPLILSLNTPNTCLVSNGKRFVAILFTAAFGSGGRILWSNDGINWTIPITQIIYPTSVTWDGSQFVLVCGTGGTPSTANNVYTSPDGDTWTAGNITISCIPMIEYTANTTADLVVGNASFYTNAQPQFQGNQSTNTVTMLSNAIVLNNLYTDNTGRVGIRNNAPAFNLDVNGSINASQLSVNDSYLRNLTVYGSQSNSGNLYAGQIPYVVTTVAGSSSGSADGTGIAARFTSPRGICIDSTGTNLYVADASNNRIRKIIIATGVVTTLAGSSAGFLDATATAAQFNNPYGICIDSTGTNLYVADASNNRIRKIVIATGLVTTLAGSAVAGYIDATGTLAQFNNPIGICIDSSGTNLYVTDTSNNRIRKIVITTGVVTTFAGSTNGSADGTGIAATFTSPRGICIDSTATNMYVTDEYKIRKIVIATAAVTTLAGSSLGSADGIGTSARFNTPRGICIDSTGKNLYLNDNDRIRRIVIAIGLVTTLAGAGEGSADGIGTAAQFNNTLGICIDSTGTNFYVADASNHRIRKIAVNFTPPLTVGTNVGINTLTPQYALDVAGTVNATSILVNGAALNVNTAGINSAGNVGINGGANASYALTVNGAQSNNSEFYSGYSPIVLSANVTTLAGSSQGSVDGIGIAASFNSPNRLCIDSTRTNIYVTDFTNHTIRRIVIATGAVTTFAGSVSGYQDGNGVSARFYAPRGICIDSTGTNLYVTEVFGYRIRKIVIATAAVTTLAGSGAQDFLDGNGVSARFNMPSGICIDTSNTNLYVADYANNRIRKIVIATAAVTTLAGSGAQGSLEGNGVSAEFNYPVDICIDSSNTNLYVADYTNNRIRKIVIATATVTTVAGSVYGNQDGNGVAAQFSIPSGICIDTSNTNLYVADPDNKRIRKIEISSSNVTTFAGSSYGSADGEALSSARFTNPFGICIDSVGRNIYVTDTVNHRIRAIAIRSAPSLTVGLNVGINTLTPQYSLDVNGTVNATSLLVNGAPVSGSAPTTQVGFANPYFINLTTVCFDPSGNMYVADNTMGIIRKMSPTGFVTFLAGAGSSGIAHADGTGATAVFNNIVKMVYDLQSASLIIADAPNIICALKLSTGVVTTFVKSLNGVTSVCADGSGNYYISDSTCIYKVTPANTSTITVPTIIAGSTTLGYLDSFRGTSAKFRNMSGLSINSAKTFLFIADGNEVVRRLSLTSPFAVATVAGRLPALTDSAAFTNSSISGIQLWFDGRDPAGNGAAITPGNMSSWADKSGNSRNATAVNSPNIASNGEVRFAATSHFTTNYVFNTGKETGFAVVLIPGTRGGISTSAILDIGTTNVTNGRQVLIFNDGNGVNQFLTGRASIGSEGNRILSIPEDVPVLFSYTITTTSLSYYYNGTQVFKLTGSFPFITTGNTSIGNANVNKVPFSMFELIVYNTILTDAERQKVEAYLIGKWNCATPAYLPPSLAAARTRATATSGTILLASSSIPGLQLWLDGADPLASGTAPGSGTIISTWFDRSGNTRHATGVSSPTFTTGGGITMNGTTQYYTTTLTAVPTTETGFIVVSVNSLNLSQDLISGSATGGREFALAPNFITLQAVNGGSATTLYSRIINLGSSEKVIFSYTTSSTRRNIFYNGLNIMTGTPATYYSGSATTVIGAYASGSQPVNGIIYEVLIFNTVLSDVNRLAIENYLNTKWDVYVPNQLKLWLDSSDPYASSRPAAPNASISRWADKSANNNDAGSLVLWLDACDVNATGIPKRSEGTVETWRDKSGYGYDAVAKNATYSSVVYPRYLVNSQNSLPVVQLQGNTGGTAQSYLTAKIPPGTFLNEIHIFMVYVWSTTTPAPTSPCLFSRNNSTVSSGSANPIDLVKINNTTTSSSLGVGDTNSVLRPVPYDIANTTFSIFSLQVSQLSQTIYIYSNGVIKDVSVATWKQSDTGDIFTIGSRANFQTGFNGNFGEIMVFNTNINGNQRQYLEGYLATKWGLRASLPSSHPYYLAVSSNPNFGSPRLGPIISTTRPNSLMVWLDGADPLGTGTAPTSGATVPTWYDKSGYGNNGSAQGVSNVYPTYTATGINFVAASTQYYSLPDFAIPYGNSSYTIIIVSKITTVSNAPLFGAGAGVRDSCISVRTDLVGTNIYTYWFSNDAYTTSGTVPVATSFIHTSTYTTSSNGSGRKVFINGKQDTLSASALVIKTTPRIQPPINNTIGKAIDSGTGLTLNGSIQEVLVFNYDLPTAQRQFVEGYLARKWSVTLAAGSVAANSVPPSIVATANLSIPGANSLQLWVDGSDPYGTGIAPPENTNIGTLIDKSGNGNNLAQPLTANQPLFNLGAVQFNTGSPAVGKMMNIPLSILNNTRAYTIFLVFAPNQATNIILGRQHDSVDSGNYLTMTQYVGATGGYFTGTTGKVYWHPNNAGTNVTSAQTYNNTKYVLSLVYDGATTTIYQNGVLDVSLASVQNIANDYAPSFYYLGSGDSTVVSTNFNLYSMMVYNTALTTPQRQTVEGYLASRYAVFLPSSHPFSYTKPSWVPTAVQASGLSFDGTAQYLVTPLPSIPTSESGFFVITAPLVAGDLMGPVPNSPYPSSGNTVQTPLVVNGREISVNNQRIYSGVTNNGDATAFTYSLSSTSVNIFSYTYSTASGITMFLNGKSIGSDSIFKRYIGAGQTALGCYLSPGPAGFFGGTVYEIMMFNTAMTDTDRKAVEAYLGAKWNIQLDSTSIDDIGSFARFNTLGGIAVDSYNNLYVGDSNLLRYVNMENTFVASTIPGLQIWLDGADPLATGTAPANGTVISTWNDKSGNARNATSVGSPAYNSSSNAIVLNGSTQGFSLTYSGIHATETTFMVVNLTSPSAYQFFINSPVGRSREFYNYNNFLTLGQQGSGTNSSNLNALIGNSNLILGFSANSTNSFLFFNGMPGPTGTAFSSVQSESTLFIGYNGTSGLYVGGTISEVLIYDQVLTASQRQQVEGYLAAKWKISLPTTHPYFGITTFSASVTEIIAGNGTASNVPGVGSNTSLTSPLDVAIYNGTPFITAGTSAFSYNPSSGYLNTILKTTGNSTQANINASSNISTQTISGIATTTIFGSGFNTVNTGVTYSAVIGITCDSNNTVYVGDKFNIRAINSNGAVTTVVGQPNNTLTVTDTGAFAAIGGGSIYGICVDNSGNIYFTQAEYNSLMKYTVSTGVLTTLLIGSPLINPRGIVYDGAQYLYIANYGGTNAYGLGNVIRYDTIANTVTVIGSNVPTFTPSGVVSIAINAQKTYVFIGDNNNSMIWILNLNISLSSISAFVTLPIRPYALACDSVGNVFAQQAQQIYKTTIQFPVSGGVVGSAPTLFATTTVTAANGMTADTNNNIYLTDYYGNVIWRVTQNGVATIYSGNGISGKNDSSYISSLTIIGQINAPQGFSGNLGINCNAPQHALDVTGIIHTNRTLFSDGELIVGTSNHTAYFRTTVQGGATYIQSGTALESLSVAPLFFTGMYGGPMLMALTATGLGIGTSAPGYKLDVVGDINFTGNLRQNGVIFSGGGGSGNLAITGSVTVNNFAFNQVGAGVNASLGNVLIGSNASGYGVIQTNGSANTLLIGGITDGGTVQIWLNNLSVDKNLTVSGNVLTPGVVTAQTNMIIGTGLLASQGRAKLHIRGGGAVTASSATANHIAFESESAGYNHYITTTHAASSSALNAIHFWLNNTTQAVATTAGTGNVNTMSVTGLGVGIGTTTPFAQLDILGGHINAGTGGSNMIAFQISGAGGGYRHFITTRHDSAGSVNTNAIDFWLNTGGASGDSTTAGTGNVRRMSVTAAGVGVNCNTPGYMLDVNGTTNLSGAVRFKTQVAHISDDGAQRFYFSANGETWFGSSNGTYNFQNNLRTINTFVIDNSGNVFLGGNSTANLIRFYGTTGDGGNTYNHTVIGECFYGSGGESSELLLFKGNDGDTASGRDRVRVLASGGFQVDISPEVTWNNGVAPPTASIAAALCVAPSGNVGIGTTTPGYKLHVTGTTYLDGQVILPIATAIKTTDGKRRLYFLENAATYIGTGNNAFNVQNTTENVNYFSFGSDARSSYISGLCTASIDGAGNFDSRGNFTTYYVGTGGGGLADDSYELWWYPAKGQGFNLGTGTTNLILRIQAGSTTARGLASFTVPVICPFANSHWYNSAGDATNRIHFELSGDTYFNVPSTKKYVFQVGGANTGQMSSTGVFSTSDNRIKKNITPSIDSLPIVNALNFCSFNFIDTLPYGNSRIQHGLIAQEVVKVYPEAVLYSDGYIPTAFSLASQILKVDSNLQITTSVPHQFIQSDNIELIIDNNRKQLPIVSIISDTEFTVAAWDNYDSSKDVFVYGKKTNDFMSIDKAQFGILAARACQTLSKEITSLQAQVASQQSTINAILAKLNI